MARVHPFQTNFTAGELTPKIAGQTDFKKYANGVEVLENLTVFPQGGASRRYGSIYVSEVKDSTKNVRLIPFEFNVEQSYVLEFGDQYIRFYKDGGAILEANKNITAITQANPAVVTVTGHGYSNGDEVYISGVSGMTQVNGKRFIVANQTANTFELSGINSSAYTAYTSGGTVARVYEIATTITESMLYEIQFTQSADTMYIVHETFDPKKLTRTGHTSWQIVDETFIQGPFLDNNKGNRTFAISNAAVGTGRTLTANNADFVDSNGKTGFAATDVGRHFRLRDGWGIITAYSSATSVTVEVKEAIGSTSASTDWALGAWAEHNGYPRTVSFYEQRLVFAGSTAFPQTIWASQSGLYTDFDVGNSDAADAFIYTIAANKVNVIRWLAPARDLIVGTAGGEFKVGRPTGEPLKPDNVTITQQTTYGGWTTEPIQIGNVVLFVQKQRKKIREFSYQFEDDAYAAPDMCLLAEHVTGTGIVDVAYAQEPESIYWAVRDDGVLLGMTYKREEDVVAWHRHILGGNNKIEVNAATEITGSNTDPLQNGFITKTAHGLITGDPVTYDRNGNTALQGLENGKQYFVVVKNANEIELAESYQQAIDRTIVQISTGTGTHIFKAQSKVRSVTSISEPEENQVWVIVERTINSVKRKYVEYLNKDVNMDSTLAGLVNGTSTVISNLDHLEGETVQILIGDAVYPNQVVTNGNITVNTPNSSGYKKIEIGLGYISKLKTMRVEAGAQAGTAQARPKRYNEVTVRLHETVGVTINGDQIPFRTSSTPVGQNIEPFTGDKRVSNLGWDREGQVIVEQTQPLPFTVLGITGTLVTSD
jgi:hypothetical protein